MIPVPRGMCSAFYKFMGAGARRTDSGEILMLDDRDLMMVKDGIVKDSEVPKGKIQPNETTKSSIHASHIPFVVGYVLPVL